MVDEKVDMWALGVVMWVLLTGRHPFDANVDLSIEEVTRRVTEEEPDLRVRFLPSFLRRSVRIFTKLGVYFTGLWFEVYWFVRLLCL